MDFGAIKCRACSSECEQMHDLFEVFENDLSLATIIEKFLNVELNSKDNLSRNVCLECAQVIIQFYNFSVTFDENNKKPDCTTENDCIFSADQNNDDEEIIIYASRVDNPDEVKSKYICEICGHISHKKSYLIDHMDIHANEPKYSCEFCPKIFQRRASLSRHRRLHIKPKQFVCEMCGQKFNDRGTLNTHISLKHLRTRDFKCLICGQKFSLKLTLEKHIKRHGHKEGAVKEFSCTICNMKYYDKSSLNRHCSTKHADVKIT